MDLSSYLELFVTEAREHIGVASTLAAGDDAREAGHATLRELFRHVHSIKGMAASMGFTAMSSLAHDAESLMDLLREARIPPEPETRRILRDTLSCLERMLDRAEARQPVDDGERAALQTSLRSLLGDTVGRGVKPVPAETGEALAPPERSREARPPDPSRSRSS